MAQHQSVSTMENPIQPMYEEVADGAISSATQVLDTHTIAKELVQNAIKDAILELGNGKDPAPSPAAADEVRIDSAARGLVEPVIASAVEEVAAQEVKRRSSSASNPDEAPPAEEPAKSEPAAATETKEEEEGKGEEETKAVPIQHPVPLAGSEEAKVRMPFRLEPKGGARANIATPEGAEGAKALAATSAGPPAKSSKIAELQSKIVLPMAPGGGGAARPPAGAAASAPPKALDHDAALTRATRKHRHKPKQKHADFASDPLPEIQAIGADGKPAATDGKNKKGKKDCVVM
mmetsp:Transcript_40251/g.125893  ORF Transcript_40251/g.125893 Transcript_40251/m.125893 type:complete len:292 (-) Transcript_40251:1794-2669(-)